MAKKIVIANWKMNPDSVGRAIRIAKEIENNIHSSKNLDVVIAPPYVFLDSVRLTVKKTKLGAQDSFWEDVGPFTGRISWHQLKRLAVQYIIIGHSENRALGETNEEINQKINAVLGAGMKAVLCVGEVERRNDIVFPQIIQEELSLGLKNIKKRFLKNLVIAYEPIWAISTLKKTKSDNPKNVFEMSILIRKELLKMFGKKTAFSTPILYGGSVDEKNAAEFVKLGKVDGLLVGGASLNANKFTEIVRKVSGL